MKSIVAKVFVGVDVSKKHLDVCIHPAKKTFRIDNSRHGIKSLLATLSKHDVQQVVCESSGGYEYIMKQTLLQRGYNVWVVDPKRIKAFIQSEGVKAKTDSIDARMIASFAAQKKCGYNQTQPSEKAEKLKSFVERKAALTKLLIMEKNRLGNPQQIYCKVEIKKHIRFLEKAIQKIDSNISEGIEADDGLRTRVEILTSVPGVGQSTAATLVSHVSELGLVSEKQAAALIGVAPYNKQSGQYVGVASISGGRPAPRRALYMAALVASRHNPKFKAIYEGLIKSGKKAKVALVAIMRRLLVVLNALVRKGEKWDPNFA